MKNRGFLLVVLILFFLSLISAELNLVITAKTDEQTSDLFISTNPNSDVSFDVYDLEYPPFPDGVRQIYSFVDSKKLIMDSWPNVDRTLKIVYEKEQGQVDNLNLLFSGDISNTYNIVLKDYGSDPTYSDLKGLTSISDKKVYSTLISENKNYFELVVDYLYCGDGICSVEENEDCLSCSNDCGFCESDFESSETSFIINSSLNQFYFLSVDELLKGFNGQFNIDSGFGVNFENKTYMFKITLINNVLQKISITSEEYFLEINNGNTSYVDLNNDLKNDLEIKVNSITDKADLFIIGKDIALFSNVPEEDKIIKFSGNHSVFDEMYSESSIFNTLRVIFPIVLLFAGVLMFVFGLFLLLRKNNISREGSREEVTYVKPAESV